MSNSSPLKMPDVVKSGSQNSSPNGSPRLHLPSPIITRRTRTESTSARALLNPQETGKVKYFCRAKGHGFITPSSGGNDIFLHISDIEGEYIPLPGDEVTYRLCPIPPKMEKYQAVHVDIVNFTPEKHLRWDSPDLDSTDVQDVRAYLCSRFLVRVARRPRIMRFLTLWETMELFIQAVENHRGKTVAVIPRLCHLDSETTQ